MKIDTFDPPKFIENISERISKFFPILRYESRLKKISLQFSHPDEKQIKAFGGVITATTPFWDDRQEPSEINFGEWKGEPLPWLKYGGDRRWFLAASEDIIGEILENGVATTVINSKMWKHFSKQYTQEYTQKRKDFEKNNLAWKHLQELNSDEMKKTMTEDQRKALATMYQSKLEKDPIYQALEEEKKDIYALNTFANYLEKDEKKEERETFQEELRKLKKEYNSDELKEVIPDEKQRLAVRGVMHKKLKKEAKSNQEILANSSQKNKKNTPLMTPVLRDAVIGLLASSVRSIENNRIVLKPLSNSWKPVWKSFVEQYVGQPLEKCPKALRPHSNIEVVKLIAEYMQDREEGKETPLVKEVLNRRAEIEKDKDGYLRIPRPRVVHQR